MDAPARQLDLLLAGVVADAPRPPRPLCSASVRRRVAQVPLGVERATAAGAGGGDRLPVGEVDQVADGEDAGEVGLRARLVDLDVAVVVQVDLALDQLRARGVADRDEGAAGLDLGRSRRSRVCTRRTRSSLPLLAGDELLAARTGS